MQQCFRCVAPLCQFRAVVAVPASALFDDIVFDAEVYKFARFADSFAEGHFKLGASEWGSQLVFGHFHFCDVAQYGVAILNG